MDAEHEARHESFLRHFTAAQPALRRFVLAHVPDFYRAEDALQEVALVLWKKFGRFREGESFLAWAFGVARNEVLHARRASARERLVLTGRSSELLDERLREMAPAFDRRRRFLQRCLKRLPENSRRVIEMKYGAALPTEKIASTLGRTANAVRVLLCRLRRAIAQCLEEALRSQAFAEETR